MARIAYADRLDPATAAIARRIEQERGKVLNLYRMLLHSPVVAEGWLAFLTAIRQQCKLAGRIRELVILRIAVINGADYEFQAHVPFALREGVTPMQIEALRAGRLDAFDERERDAVAYCEAMTREIHVPDTVFQAVRRHFDPTELVELTATVAAYNMVSRFLEALQIDPEPASAPAAPLASTLRGADAV